MADREELLRLTDEALEDCRTHRDSWRGAVVGARDTAQVSPPDIDDRSYWQHELDVFDRTFAALALAAASLRARAQDPLRAHGGGE